MSFTNSAVLKMDIQRLARLLDYQQQDPNNFSLCIDVGFLQLALDKLDDAKKSSIKAIDLAPDKFHGYSLRGLVAIREGDYDTAGNALSRSIELGETAPGIAYNCAYALAHIGRFEEAEAPASQAAQLPNDLPHAPALYIRILHYLGKVEEAIIYGESLTGEKPPRVNALLSTLYMDAENLEKARGAALAALDDDADNADARTTLGLLALQQLDATTAEAEFERALTTQQNQGRALLGKGLSALLQGDLPKTVAILEQVVTKTNLATHVGSWHTLAWSHILQKDIDSAERAFKKSLEIDRNFAETHGGLAVTALMRGNMDSAIQSAKRAQGLNKNNFSGRFAEGLIQQVSGNRDRAAAIIDQVLNQSVLPDGRSIQALLVERMVRGEDKQEHKTLH